MLEEIHNHLVYVLSERLGWHTIERPEISVGGGHVVIRFGKNGRRMVFRVPKHSAQQLKRTMLAYRHVGSLGFMPEKIYHDGKCIIESHVEGLPIGPQASGEVIVGLAGKLSLMHAIPAERYGPLDFDCQGSHLDPGAYYRGQPAISVDRSESDLSPDESSTLNMALVQAADVPPGLQTAKTYIGHGELWRKNILVQQHDFKIIDWDRIGAYPIEQDLAVLIDADWSAAQRALFFENYTRPVNFDWLKWFARRRILLDKELRLQKKIQKIKEIDLI
nr:phosphotransferase [Polaromonas sp. CG_9.11]